MKIQIADFYDKYLSQYIWDKDYFEDYKAVSLELFEEDVVRYGEQKAFELAVSMMFAEYAIRSRDIPVDVGFVYSYTPYFEYHDSGAVIGPFVAQFFPHLPAADQAALIEQVKSGELSIEWVAAAVPLGQTGSLAEIVETAQLWEDMASVADPAKDFATGLYIAAFGRAGEHAGVEYWLDVLEQQQASGMGGGEALQALAGHMYYAGSLHGEGGTNIADTKAYVQFVYQNVLGRPADAGGLAYWVREIDSGTIPREKFLADYLYSALQTGDSTFLQARIDVATYVAREAVSGGAQSLDLVGVLAGVKDLATAVDRIAEIKTGEFTVDTSGVLAMSASMPLEDDLVLLLASWDVPTDPTQEWVPEGGELVVLGEVGAEGGDWFA